MLNLSIIVPVFEESKNIEKLVSGIVNNIKIDNYEILFVDDNSPDGTGKFLENISPRAEAINTTNHTGHFHMDTMQISPATVATSVLFSTALTQIGS